MNSKVKKSDSIKNDSNSRTRSTSFPKKITKKQIRTKSNNSMFVGIDLHKKFLQVAIMDDTGKVSHNDKVDNTHQSTKKHFAKIPISVNIVMESSSVWYDTYRFLTDELKYKNVILSNPYLTKAIADYLKGKDDIFGGLTVLQDSAWRYSDTESFDDLSSWKVLDVS